MEMNIESVALNVLRLYPVRRAALFGSAAMGNLHDGSDVDKYNILKTPIRGMASQYYLVERCKAESFDAPLIKGKFLDLLAGYNYSDFVVVWHVDMDVINGVRAFPNARERRGLSAIAIVPPGDSVSADELLYYRSKDIFATGKTKSGYSLTVSGDFEVSVT